MAAQHGVGKFADLQRRHNGRKNGRRSDNMLCGAVPPYTYGKERRRINMYFSAKDYLA